MIANHLGLNGIVDAVERQAYMEAMAEMEDKLKKEHATAGTSPHSAHRTHDRLCPKDWHVESWKNWDLFLKHWCFLAIASLKIEDWAHFSMVMLCHFLENNDQQREVWWNMMECYPLFSDKIFRHFWFEGASKWFGTHGVAAAFAPDGGYSDHFRSALCTCVNQISRHHVPRKV